MSDIVKVVAILSVALVTVSAHWHGFNGTGTALGLGAICGLGGYSLGRVKGLYTTPEKPTT